MHKHIQAALGFAVAFTAAATAQEAPKYPLPDFGKPLVLRAGAPICVTAQGIDTMLALAAQHADDMATRVEGCFSLVAERRVYLMESRGFLPPTFRLRWEMPSGAQWEGWTVARAMRNGDPEPVSPELLAAPPKPALPASPARRRS